MRDGFEGINLISVNDVASNYLTEMEAAIHSDNPYAASAERLKSILTFGGER